MADDRVEGCLHDANLLARTQCSCLTLDFAAPGLTRWVACDFRDRARMSVERVVLKNS